MSEFFHGWRRKVGCGSLFIACLLMGAHLRSQVYADNLRCRLARGNELSFTSQHNMFYIGYQRVTKTVGIPPARPAFSWTTQRFDTSASRWQFTRLELNYGEWSQGDDFNDESGWSRRLAVPYPVLSLPLTLLSVYLILISGKRFALSFLQGWRRKAGSVSLVATLVLASAWIGTWFGNNQIHVIVESFRHTFSWAHGEFVWTRYTQGTTGLSTAFWYSWPLQKDFPDPFAYSEIRSRWDWGQFQFAQGLINGRDPITRWAIPCWAAVLPLCLFTAYLLLGKPRKRI